ncbi:MAG TPA: BatA and WFA domain-containing protein [Phycisphaerae bacterium]|jgi:hypothetical protein
MNLLAPWALWFGLVGAAVIALYLLKIKRQRQTVPSLEFWQALAGQVRARSLFQRLKRWVSLFLWLLIVTCLMLALGNPVLTLGKVKPRSIVVILDNSASMQTLEDAAQGITRLKQAVAALDEMLARRPVDDEWMLIDAARQARVLVSWTRDRRSVRDAARSVQPHLGSADLSAARELAADLLADKPEPTIVVLSDGAAGQVDLLAAKDSTLVHWAIGKADDNLGIALLRVRPHRQQAVHYAQIRVVNACSNEVSSQIVFELDGSTTAVEPFTIAGRGTWEKTVPVNRPQGGVLRAYIDRPDALAADNEAFAILEPLRPARVRLVCSPREAFFFEQALLAMEPLVDPEASHTLTLEEYERAGNAGEPADLTIFNNSAPKNLPASGAFIFVNAWPADLPARITGILEHPTISIARRDHPLTQYLSMNVATVTRAAEVLLTERATILADSNTGSPLIFLVQQPDRMSLCLAFDVLETDLPFRNAFPVLLRNAVVHLVSQQQAWVRDQYAIGEPIESLRSLPAGLEQVAAGRLEKNQQVRETTLDVRNGAFRYDDTAAAGPLRFRIGEETAYAAVTLNDENESRIAPTGARAAEDAERQLALSGRLFSTVPWVALATIAAALIGLEWLTYHFRWTE